MKLVFAHIEAYKNIIDQNINFSSLFDIVFDKETSSIRLFLCPRYKMEAVPFFMKPEYLDKVHVIVGKSGSGKSNLLEVLAGNVFDSNVENSQYFLLYAGKTRGENSYRFIIECKGYEIVSHYDNQLLVQLKDDYVARKKQSSTYLRYTFLWQPDKNCIRDVFKLPYRAKNENLVNIHDHLTKKNTILNIFDLTKSHEIGIINGYDENSLFCKVRRLKFPVKNSYDNEFNARINLPFNEISILDICKFINSYYDEIEVSAKSYEFTLKIALPRWSREAGSNLNENLRYQEYGMCYDSDRIDDDIQINILPVKYNGEFPITEKDKYIHDFLVDVAICLRDKIDNVEGINMIKADKKADRMFIHKPQIKTPNVVFNFDTLPDKKGLQCVEDYLLWLGAYMDYYYESGYDENIKERYTYYVEQILEIANHLELLHNKYFINKDIKISISDVVDPYNYSILNAILKLIDDLRDVRASCSKGVDILTPELSKLSSGEYQYGRILAWIHQCCDRYLETSKSTKTSEYGRCANLLLLLDEPETYMHPEMSRVLLKKIYKMLEIEGFENVQLVITTHSPFMITDLFSKQLTALDYNEYGLCQVSYAFKESPFANNIYSVLANGFFLKYVIGDYAVQRINETRDQLNHEIRMTHEKAINNLSELQKIEMFSNSIGDCFIRQQIKKLIEKAKKRI